MRSLGSWIQSEPLKLHHQEGLFLAGPTTVAERRDADKNGFQRARPLVSARSYILAKSYLP